MPPITNPSSSSWPIERSKDASFRRPELKSAQIEGSRKQASFGTGTNNSPKPQAERMAYLTTRSGCFRESLVSYFIGPKRVAARRSFSAWLLELVFADRGVTQQKVICCDACQQGLIGRQGQLAFVKKVFGT
jgi:hypothetical protein